jgi:hypothetical protein
MLASGARMREEAGGPHRLAAAFDNIFVVGSAL